jgi:hypothetical protein
MDKTITADDLLSTVERWHQLHYPAWDLEARLDAYANGGPAPTDDPECDAGAPLGFAASYLKPQFDALVDTLDMEPGFLEAVPESASEQDRSTITRVKSALDVAANKVVTPLVSQLKAAAGRATVTGRATLVRKSPTDACFRNTKLLHPVEYGLDPHDPEFREWAIRDRLTLREIDEMLKTASATTGPGWRRAGLEALKLWILADESTKDASRNGREWTQAYDRKNWLELSLSACVTDSTNPVEVYWYFKKNGQMTKKGEYTGHEKIDLWCISRFGSRLSVSSRINGDVTQKWLATDNSSTQRLREKLEALQKTSSAQPTGAEADPRNERLIYAFPDRFDSVEQCLQVFVDDARISGDQELCEVRGPGRQATPRLAVQEEMLRSMIEGVTFAAQPHWTIAGPVPEEYRRTLERQGARSYQSFPANVKLLDKNNGLQGFQHAASAIQMLDRSLAMDANSLPVQGAPGSDFAADAAARLASNAEGLSRRVTRWRKCLSRVAAVVGSVILDPKIAASDTAVSRFDATRMRYLAEKELKGTDISLESVTYETWCFTCRGFAGGMTRSQAIQVNSQMLQLVGPVFPDLVQFFAQEILRATYGDVIASRLVSPPDKEQAEQMSDAIEAAVLTFVSMTPMPVEGEQNPLIFGQVAVKSLQMRTEAAARTGSVTAAEQTGMAALAQLAASHAGRLPPAVAQPMLQQITQLATAASKIDLQQPNSGVSELEAAKLQMQQQNIQRLQADADRKHQLNEIKTLAGLRQAGANEQLTAEQIRMLQASRASIIHDIASDVNETTNGITAA